MTQSVNQECLPCAEEPGSFRDRNNRVYYQGDHVLRGLSPEALAAWEKLSQTRFFPSLIESGQLVGTELLKEAGNLDADAVAHWAGFLRHEAIPFISYPYEWSFGMLKDAALLHLDLIEAALEEGMILKDSSAYNVQWQGAKPTFIDITSFEPLAEGEPWVGYRQFCQMFLYPLMMQAYRDLPFQPWMRGHIDGVEAADCSKMMTLKDLLRPGVMMHVHLQAKMEAMYANSQSSSKSQLKKAGFSPDLIKANLKQLRHIINKLTWGKTKTEWSDYADNNTYTSEEHQAKARFVRDVSHSRKWQRVWDLGCNTGTFSRIAAENADYVVSMDIDPLAIERFYQALKAEGNTKILPLINNLADPSPNLGWRGLERKSLPERGRPQLTLALALIHHVVITANIPVAEFVNWLAGLGTELVIEFVTKDDPMVKRLLQNKTDNYTDYTQEYFETAMNQVFFIQKSETLTSGTRILYHAAPKQ